MDIVQKLEVLKKLDTKNLIVKLHEYEDELEKALREQAEYSSQNYEYVASRGSDCPRVKEIIAELSLQAPETKPVFEDKTKQKKTGDKKTTVAEREAWLQDQRQSNQGLNNAIAQQREVAFFIDSHQIKCEMAKKRLEGIKAVLASKTAQIRFLSGDE